MTGFGKLFRFRVRPVPTARMAAAAWTLLVLALAGCGDDAGPAGPTTRPPTGPPPVVVSGPWAAELSAFDAQGS